MKLDFEKWLDQQKISGLAKEVLHESVTCYKASAYRAAMMLAFTGFQIILKDRINSASDPGGLTPPNKWNYIITNLQDPDKWDTLIATEIIPSTDPTKRIMELGDDLISQYKYWKYRRNDAAHSKDNKLGSSHIESFWLFLESNLPKFVVRGSQQEIINRIKTYFDLNLTPRNADFKPLAEEFASTIESTKIISILSDIKSIVHQSKRPYEQKISFWDYLLGIEKVQEDLLTFLLKPENHKVFYGIIRHNPSRLGFIHDETLFLRKIYNELLFDYGTPGEFGVFTYLVKHKLIPEDEKNEIYNSILRAWLGQFNFNDEYIPEVSTEDYATLKNTLFPLWRARIIPNMDNRDWGNRVVNKNLVIDFIKAVGLDKELVVRIYEVFSNRFHPFGLANSISYLFADAPEIKEQFKKLAADNELDLEKLPKHWHLLDATEENNQEGAEPPTADLTPSE